MPTEKEWIKQAEEYERIVQENKDPAISDYYEKAAIASREASCYAAVEKGTYDTDSTHD